MQCTCLPEKSPKWNNRSDMNLCGKQDTTKWPSLKPLGGSSFYCNDNNNMWRLHSIFSGEIILQYR